MVLWVTSFPEEFYHVSGKALIKSFHEFNIEGDLLIGKEGFIPEYRNKHGDIVMQIDDDPLLTQYMCDNRKVIPKELGGLADHCGCPHPKKHKKPNCIGTWWNRNAFRWFRKAVTLNSAFKIAEKKNYSAVVWIDSDCVFIKKIDNYFLNEQFASTSSFHMLGKRKHSETSIMGFNLLTDGKKVFDTFLSRYTSGEFRKDVRWDDCWQYDLTRKSLSPEIKFNDIAKHTDTGNVLRKTELGKYIVHDKGRHGRKLGIMK